MVISAAAATIIAGIFATTGVVAGSAISAGSARKAGEMQERAVGEANVLSQKNWEKQLQIEQKNWREEMQAEEEQRKKNNLRTTMLQFQSTINQSDKYKKTVADLWAGR